MYDYLYTCRNDFQSIYAKTAKKHNRIYSAILSQVPAHKKTPNIVECFVVRPHGATRKADDPVNRP